jgi:GNAT superfamily N-acetyltransferase
VGGATDDDPFWANADEWWRRTELRDGTRVLLRQIRPSDRDRLAAGMHRLSPAARYLRCHTRGDELTPAQLDYLTRVDHVDHEAIVALDVDRPQRPGVGVARYIREPYEPEIAEAAVTVADEYHGLGAGTLLLGALAARARDNGIVVFRNYVLDGNDAMLQVFDDLGARREREPEGLWRVDLDLPDDDEQPPASGASRAFVEVARDDRGLISLVPPIWGRWRRSMKARSEDVDQDEQDDDAIPQDDLDRWLRRRGDR